MTRFILTTILSVLISVNMLGIAQATDEVAEVKTIPVTIQDLNFQYGDAQFAWHRIYTDKFHFEVNDAGDMRFGFRDELGYIGKVGVHGRISATLSGTDITEIRPELMFYQKEWYSFVSTGIDTNTGVTSLYTETVWDFARQDNWSFGVALVQNGGLSGQDSTFNLGPHLNVQLNDDFNLDLHWGAPLTKDTDNEMWAILKWNVQ